MLKCIKEVTWDLVFEKKQRSQLSKARSIDQLTCVNDDHQHHRDRWSSDQPCPCLRGKLKDR
jgi:hypothetical protein